MTPLSVVVWSAGTAAAVIDLSILILWLGIRKELHK